MKQIALSTLTFLAGLLSALMLAEIIARTVLVVNHRPVEKQSASEFSPAFFMTADPILGWKNRANASGMVQDESPSFVSINRWGLRGPEVSKEKPQNTVRIAVIGDSFTLATQVEETQTYVRLLERDVRNTCALSNREDLQLLNFGVNGYGSTQHSLQLNEIVSEWKPDVIIHGFYLGNDVTDNSKSLENLQLRPFYEIKPDGELELDFSFNAMTTSEANQYLALVSDMLPARLIQHSRLVQFIRSAEYQHRLNKLGAKLESISAQTFVEPQSPEWKDAWQITEKVLRLIKETADNHRAQYLLFTIGTPLQVHPDNKIRAQVKASLGINDFDYPGRRLQHLAQALQMNYIRLDSVFSTQALDSKECLHGFDANCFGHWNQTGHQLASQTLAPTVCKLITQSLERRDAALH